MIRTFLQVALGVLVTGAAIVAPVRVAGATNPAPAEHVVQNIR